MKTCTCRTTRRERFENPDCPIHGWRETARLEGRNVDLVALQRRLDETAAIRAELEVRCHE
jgi:hypothetical protein